MAEPVVLLHCSGSSGAQWRSLAERLNARYRVLAPDLIGYGSAAPWAGRGDFGLEHEAAAIRSLLGRLGEPAHLVGHSYGGGVALHLARTRPELLRSLTLIEPTAFHLLRDGDVADRAALLEVSFVAAQVREALGTGDYQAAFGLFLDYWNGPGSWDALPVEKRDAFAPQVVKVALEFHALTNEPAGIDDLRGIVLPTLLVQGARTKLVTRCICKRLLDVLPRAAFRVVPGAGHMAPVTHRDPVNALVAEHLESAGPHWRAVANG